MAASNENIVKCIGIELNIFVNCIKSILEKVPGPFYETIGKIIIPTLTKGLESEDNEIIILYKKRDDQLAVPIILLVMPLLPEVQQQALPPEEQPAVQTEP